MAESLIHRLEPGDISMMVGSPDVDELFKVSVIFVFQVSHIRCKVCRHSVSPYEDPVLVVPKKGGPEPQGPVLLIGKIPLLKLFHSRVDLPVVIK